MSITSGFLNRRSFLYHSAAFGALATGPALRGLAQNTSPAPQTPPSAQKSPRPLTAPRLQGARPCALAHLESAFCAIRFRGA